MSNMAGVSHRIPITAENESWKDMLKTEWGSTAKIRSPARARVDQISFSRPRISYRRKTRTIIMARWLDTWKPAIKT